MQWQAHRGGNVLFINDKFTPWLIAILLDSAILLKTLAI